MNLSKNKDAENPKKFIKLVLLIVGALGGVAAIFAFFGYLIVLSYLFHLELYGLADFPSQFYKETLITFLTKMLEFYGKKLYMLLWAIPIAFGPLFYIKRAKERLKDKRLGKGLNWFGVFFVSVVILLTLILGAKFLDDNLKRILLFSVSFPVFLALFINLAFNFSSFNYKKPFENCYGFFLSCFIFLSVLISMGYGAFIYDINVYIIDIPECEKSVTAFNALPTQQKLLYMMGHTSGREIFFDITSYPRRVILVDRALVKSVAVNYFQDTKKLREVKKLFLEKQPGAVAPMDTIFETTDEEEEEWLR